VSYEHCEKHDCEATNGCAKCLCPDCFAPEENHDTLVCVTRQRDEARMIVMRLVVDRGTHFDGLWIPVRRWLLGADSRIQAPEVREEILRRYK
jgi:hypothetical protein